MDMNAQSNHLKKTLKSVKSNLDKEIITLTPSLLCDISDIVCLIDRNGHIVTCNKAFPDYMDTDISGTSIYDHIAPDYHNVMKDSVSKAFKKEEVPSFDIAGINSDGAISRFYRICVKPIIQNKKINELLLIASDVTAEIDHIHQLNLKDRYYHTLIQNALDVIIVLNEDVSIRFESPSIQKITGFTPEERMGMSGFDLIDPNDLPKAASLFKKLLIKDGSIERTEIRLRHKDNSWRIIEVIGKNLINDPVVCGIVVNLRDINDQKQAEETLSKSEERYRLLAENINDVIWIMDLDRRITYISPSITTQRGFTVEEAIQLSIKDMVAPSSRQVLLNGLARVLDYGNSNQSDPPSSQILEMELYCKDGSTIWTETSMTYLPGPDGKLSGILGVTRDISERKRMENELRIKENALENSLNAMAMSDMSGNITYINKSAQKMWGNDTKEDIIGQPYWHLINIGDSAASREIATNMLKAGHWEGELLSKRGNDQDTWVHVLSSVVKDDLGNPIQTISSFIDITEKKKAEAQLKESEEKFKRFLEEMNDCYCVLQDNIIVFVNERGAEMFGYTQEEVIGKNVCDLLSPEVFDELLSINSRRYHGERISPQYETMVVKKNGQALPVELGARLIEYNSRPAISAVIRDITERKHAEEERHHLEQQLLLAGRLAAVGELAAGVAHELNNPLAAVSGYAQFLASRADLDNTVREDIETIYQNAQRAARITSNLLSFARRHKPEKNLISLNKVIAQSLDLNAYRMKVNNINIEVELDPGLPEIMADFHQLQQVFVNIINNAEQAMIETHGKGKLLVKSRKTDGLVVIEFTDDGPGIPEENLSRIFDPFFTTKEVGKGTGLGLSICYGIIEQHGGKVYVNSKPGQGTTFTIEIPVVQQAQSANS